MAGTAKGGTKADKFSSLFDQDWKGAKSTIRNRTEALRTYDVMYSWDAMSDDPQPNSRLKQTLVPEQTCRPIVLSGKAVVGLEQTVGFDAINVKMPTDKAKGMIPLTQEQADLGMRPDLSGHIPLIDEKAHYLVPMVETNKAFRNYYVNSPDVVVMERPAYMVAAGPQCDERLLNPKQRRSILEFEKKEKEAKVLIQSAKGARDKVKKQLSGVQFHRGVLMVDNNANLDSEVYGQKARENLAENEYKDQIRLERKSRLASKQSAMTLNGNLLVPESVAPRVKLNPAYQAKGGDYHALSFDETHNRLFCRMQAMNNDVRTQRLRDLDLNGKEYSITQHTAIEHWPSRHVDRIVDKNMDHPSQSSLEGSRNLQGTLRPF
jgi:hypothetical protein